MLRGDFKRLVQVCSVTGDIVPPRASVVRTSTVSACGSTKYIICMTNTSFRSDTPLAIMSDEVVIKEGEAQNFSLNTVDQRFKTFIN